MNEIVLEDSLSTQVANYIKEKILLERSFINGNHILETEIAATLNVSRTTVREALKELQSQGFLEYIPRRGAHVLEFTEADIEEILNIRFLLESQIYREIIDNNILTEDDFVALYKIIDEMVLLTSTEDDTVKKTYLFSKKDLSFHQYLWERAGKKWSLKIMTNLYYQFLIAIMKDLFLEANLEQSARAHYKLLEKIKVGDYEGLVETYVKHVLTLKKKSSPLSIHVLP